MPTTTELEKTFLLREIPEGLEKCEKTEIVDRYIPTSSPHPVIRIRKSGEKLEMTKKQPAHGTDSSEQHEHTIELSKAEYEALCVLPAKETIKTRYFFVHKGRKADIDVFHGKLEGLTLADFEFKIREEMEKFRMPDFCLANVTQEKFMAGGMLCGKSYKDIEPKLKMFGYRKILFKK